jgi:hypothetical protein
MMQVNRDRCTYVRFSTTHVVNRAISGWLRSVWRPNRACSNSFMTIFDCWFSTTSNYRVCDPSQQVPIEAKYKTSAAAGKQIVKNRTFHTRNAAGNVTFFFS